MAMLSAEAQVLLADTECKLFAAGLVLAFITIFTRGCYRIAEMVGGWANTIMQNETDFVVPDGVMVLVVSLCLTILHPGFCFPGLATCWQSGLGDVNRHPARLCTLPRKTLSRQSLLTALTIVHNLLIHDFQPTKFQIAALFDRADLLHFPGAAN